MYPEKNREIIEKSRKGDLRAQYSLYNQYAKAMLNVSYRLMGTIESAEDILQDSFTEAFRMLHTYRFDSAFGAWLKRIVVNKCINEIKRKKADLRYYDDMAQFNPNTEVEEGIARIKCCFGKESNGAASPGKQNHLFPLSA